MQSTEPCLGSQQRNRFINLADIMFVSSCEPLSESQGQGKQGRNKMGNN